MDQHEHEALVLRPRRRPLPADDGKGFVVGQIGHEVSGSLDARGATIAAARQDRSG
jgi:hypothetical protein